MFQAEKKKREREPYFIPLLDAVVGLSKKVHSMILGRD